MSRKRSTWTRSSYSELTKAAWANPLAKQVLEKANEIMRVTRETPEVEHSWASGYRVVDPRSSPSLPA